MTTPTPTTPTPTTPTPTTAIPPPSASRAAPVPVPPRYDPVEWLTFVNQVQNIEDVRDIVNEDAEVFKGQMKAPRFKSLAADFQQAILLSDWRTAEAVLEELRASRITRRVMWYGWQNLAEGVGEHVDIFNTVVPRTIFEGGPSAPTPEDQRAFDAYVVDTRVPPRWSQRTASRARLLVQLLVYCEAKEVRRERGRVLLNQDLHLYLQFAIKCVANNDYRLALHYLRAAVDTGFYGIDPEVELLTNMIQLDGGEVDEQP